MRIKIAIVLTTYNRAQTTRRCLSSLKRQKDLGDVIIDLYVCDDKSNDDTVNVIRSVYPNANIYISNGDLFWSKGMYKAMELATKNEHDFYLMMNDDLELEDNCIKLMLTSYYSKNTICGIAGCTKSMDGQSYTYGGRIYKSKLKLGKSEIVKPDNADHRCDVANWNCFLIPSKVIEIIGLIDDYYQHSYGDYDYCLRMGKAGIPIFVSDDYIGRTNRNSSKGTYKDTSLPKGIRIKKYFSRKAYPISSQLHFYFKNYGIIGIIYSFAYNLYAIISILTH